MAEDSCEGEHEKVMERKGGNRLETNPLSIEKQVCFSGFGVIAAAMRFSQMGITREVWKTSSRSSVYFGSMQI